MREYKFSYGHFLPIGYFRPYGNNQYTVSAFSHLQFIYIRTTAFHFPLRSKQTYALRS